MQENSPTRESYMETATVINTSSVGIPFCNWRGATLSPERPLTTSPLSCTHGHNLNNYSLSSGVTVPSY